MHLAAGIESARAEKQLAMRTLPEVDRVPIAHRQRCERRDNEPVAQRRVVAREPGEGGGAERPPEDIASCTLCGHARGVVEAFEVARIKLDMLIVT